MTVRLTILIAAAAWTAATLAQAQGFSSGSDGSDGALLVSEDLDLGLPPDGTFHFTTITVAVGATLSFAPNALNTPVYLLATGDVVIEGTIDVTGGDAGESPLLPGRGGPGGFDGGWPETGNGSPGDGQGPGGGSAGTQGALSGSNCSNASFSLGNGAYGSRGNLVRDEDGLTHGSRLLVPLLGGSGGGGSTGLPGRGGGAGGGALLIASETRIDVLAPGELRALGGMGGTDCNPGSGGAVRLVAPIVAGDGTIDVTGGLGLNFTVSSPAPDTGGHGRIRVDALDRFGIAFNYQPSAAQSTGSLLLVRPDPAPRLDIVHAAGTDIAVGTGATVEIVLPFGSPTSQPVTVQASGLSGLVPVDVVVTPESGSRSTYSIEIDMSAGDGAEATAQVELEPNTINHIHAWIR